MSDEQDLKLACLHHAGGDLDHAKALFEWVSGSVRATTDSEAPEVSAPDQDKPEEPFNYRHPSKFGTDIPRRCHLEELTPEERAIRDLVGTVESLGAHPLLTTTVIQLMKAGESLADWVDIELRDKAISALQSLSSGEGGVGLLDGEPEPVPTEVRKEDEQDAEDSEWSKGWASGWAGHDLKTNREPEWYDGYEEGAKDRATGIAVGNPHVPNHGGTHPEPPAPPSPEVASEQGGESEAPAIPEGFIPWSGGERPVGGLVQVIYRILQTDIGDEIPARALRWTHLNRASDIIAYRIVEPSADAERIEDASQGTPSIEQSPEAYDPINKGEEPASGEAQVFAAGINREIDAKAEPKKFGGIFSFGAKKTLVGEGV